MIDDLALCVSGEWLQHFNSRDYTGSWTSISLRSASGNAQDIYAHPDTENYRDTPLMQKCSYFREIIDSFKCRKEAVRLLRLAPGSIIKEHSDLHAGYEYGFFRLHIPITTDDRVIFRVDACELHMNAGECWYANFHLPHSVEHNGTKDRVHLVIDGCRNEWSDQLFASAGYDLSEEQKAKDYDNDTKRKMIEHLSQIDTSAARDLIAQLEKELSQGR